MEARTIAHRFAKCPYSGSSFHGPICDYDAWSNEDARCLDVERGVQSDGGEEESGMSTGDEEEGEGNSQHSGGERRINDY